jgi:hypothetical protein
VSGRESDDRKRSNVLEENRKLRWLRVQSDLLKAVLYQDRALGLSDARRLVYDFRRRVLEVFPGEEHTFDLLLLPRFERVIRERWGENLDARIH